MIQQEDMTPYEKRIARGFFLLGVALGTALGLIIMLGFMKGW